MDGIVFSEGLKRKETQLLCYIPERPFQVNCVRSRCPMTKILHIDMAWNNEKVVIWKCLNLNSDLKVRNLSIRSGYGSVGSIIASQCSTEKAFFPIDHHYLQKC